MEHLKLVTCEGCSKPRHLLLVIQKDGSFCVMEDEPKELEKYRAKRDEYIKRFRKWT